MKPWGEVYRLALRRGFDHGYAAFVAEKYSAREKPSNNRSKLTGGDSATPEGLSDQPVLSTPEGDPGLFRPAGEAGRWADYRPRINIMQISIIPLHGEPRLDFDLSDVGNCYPDDDVIYFAGVPCFLSSALPANPLEIFSSPDSASAWVHQVFDDFKSAQQQNAIDRAMPDESRAEAETPGN